MVHVYLVDYLGIHCGMHYYLEAFKKVLTEIPDIEVEILSNYSDKKLSKPFFLNQYKGMLYRKGFSYLMNLYRLHKFTNHNKKALFIFLTYGNPIDYYFIKMLMKTQNLIIDIHEVIAQDIDHNEKFKSKLKSLYINNITNVISHSKRTDDFLIQFDYKRQIFHVPHFRYIFPKTFNSKLISPEILQAIDHDKINLLFFGNITRNKGIDLLLNAYNYLSDTSASKVNLIIAGKDYDACINSVEIKGNRNIKIFKRHINDDELTYLYQNVDYICLPYRKTSQSGILEMAFYFKKPIIATDIPYFKKMLNEFPSFGILAGQTSSTYKEGIEEIILRHKKMNFFTENDYDKYVNRKEIKLFQEEFRRWIGSKFISKREK